MSPIQNFEQHSRHLIEPDIPIHTRLQMAMEVRDSLESESSLFESSEMLAAYLLSTLLLEESWRRCSHANASAQQSFAVDHVGTEAYVAFSGAQAIDCSKESCQSLVDLESGIGKAIWGSFCGGDEEEPVMVHGGLLRLFVSFYHSHNFQQKMHQVLNECKSVIFTGHSLGGAVASLSALWFLSILRPNSPSIRVMCVTFGSPMLGNQSFSRAILQEKWAGHFLHVVAQDDLLPRLLFAPASPFIHELSALFEFWHCSMASASACIVPRFSLEGMEELVRMVAACMEEQLSGCGRNSFWPFGSYMFCTGEGAVCLDNGVAIVRLLYLMLAANGGWSVEACVGDHLRYDHYVGRLCWRYLLRWPSADMCLSESTSEAGAALALRSSGLDSEEHIYGAAKSCLAMARQLECRLNLNAAKMAVSLSKVTPLRAQIEWYKAFCDASDDQWGYYDSFKQRGASKRGSKVNMNRIRLATFWDHLLSMLASNQLTHDFHKLPKYVNASRFYTLLVEPLEIAEYYRTGAHKKKGHYIEHGREKRFKIFERWWGERKVGDEENCPRSRFASLTQDSCFWARVEEAREYVHRVTSEVDSVRNLELLEEVERFEKYARGMVEMKEVSVDVLAKNSSYGLFREEWEMVKFQLKLMPAGSGSQDAKVQEFGLDAAFHGGK